MSVKQSHAQHHGKLRHQDAQVLAAWSTQVLDALIMLCDGESSAETPEQKAARATIDATRKQVAQLQLLSDRRSATNEVSLARQMMSVALAMQHTLAAVGEHVANAPWRMSPTEQFTAEFAKNLLARVSAELKAHIPDDVEALLRASEQAPNGRPVPATLTSANASRAEGFTTFKEATPGWTPGVAPYFGSFGIHQRIASSSLYVEMTLPNRSSGFRYHLVPPLFHPQHGAIRAIKYILLICWAVVVGYLGMVAGNLLELGQRDIAGLTDWTTLVRAFIPPGLPTDAHTTLIVGIITGLTFAFLVVSSFWVAINSVRERQSTLAMFQAIDRTYFEMAKPLIISSIKWARPGQISPPVVNALPPGLPFQREPAPPRVFVSHHHADAPFARRLVFDLIKAGVDVYLDDVYLDRDSLVGDDFVRQITKALQRSEWLIFVQTPDALTSKYVHMEVDAALQRTLQHLMSGIITMVAAPEHTESALPLWPTLDRFQRFDATSDYEGAIAKVLRLIKSGSAPAPTPLH